MSETNVEHVVSLPAESDDHLVTVQFFPVSKPTEKGPKYRYHVCLNGSLDGLVLSGPIMQDARTGKFTPRVPSIYGDDAVQVRKEVEMINGRAFYGDNPNGAAILSDWSDTLLTAFLAYRQTGKAEQRISFRR